MGGTPGVIATANNWLPRLGHEVALIENLINHIGGMTTMRFGEKRCRTERIYRGII